MAGRPADVAGVGAGPRPGARGGDAIGLERPGDGGGRAAQDRGLDGAVHQPRELGGLGAPAPVLRSVLNLPDGVVRARLYGRRTGLYAARLNGRPVGD
jgi:hypothetical protein